MSLMRCPKCQSIIDSEDESCHYCGFQLKKVAKEVALPSKDSLDIDSEKFESFTGDKTLNEKHVAISTNDSSKTKISKNLSSYSKRRLKALRWKYFILMVISLLLFLGIGTAALCAGINEIITIGKSEAYLGVGIGLLSFGLPLVIYCLVRFIQSFKNPILAVATEDNAKNVQPAEIVGAVAEIITEILS